MPKAAPAAGTGTPVTGDHSNAIEIAAPVVEEEAIDAPVGDLDKLGSHREEDLESDADDGEDEEVEVPARLKGKSKAQIYKEFTSLEQDRSRRVNELSEARGLLRQALESALKATPGAVKPEEDPDLTAEDFDTDPQAATTRLIKKQLKPLQDAVLSAEQRALIVEFNARRPGYLEEVATPEFQEWVKQSPYRMRMVKAASNFDMEAADDLFAMWDASKPAVGEETETPAEKKKTAIKRVTTETGGAGKAASGKSGKKIYKSSELARLYVQDRERYNEMAPEIRAAFAEGRVR